MKKQNKPKTTRKGKIGDYIRYEQPIGSRSGYGIQVLIPDIVTEDEFIKLIRFLEKIKKMLYD